MRAHGAVLRSPPRQPAAAPAEAGRASCTRGGIAAVPTDSSYALVCHLDDKAAADQLRRIRGVDDKHHLTLLCRDLSELASYARVDNRQYRLLKLGTPGPFTFILEATKEVPRRVTHPPRRTIGLRVPDHRVTQELLDLLGEPLLATTLIPPGETEPLNDPQRDPRALREADAGRRRCRRLPDAADHGGRPHAATSRCWCATAAAIRRCSGCAKDDRQVTPAKAGAQGALRTSLREPGFRLAPE